jgi:hypothetical protein
LPEHDATGRKMFTKRFTKWVRTASLAFVGAFLFATVFTVYALRPERAVVGYEPEQPVPFSHKVMAGDNGIPCLYCHPGAERGAVAGVPSVETCMNCHRFIQPKREDGPVTPAMAALLEHVDPETLEPIRPIVWRKVYDLADFVYFDHSRHVRDAGIECSECHGPVERMERVRRVRTLKMAWCLDCHRKPPQGTGENVARWREGDRWTRGPTDCSACHR